MLHAVDVRETGGVCARFVGLGGVVVTRGSSRTTGETRQGIYTKEVVDRSQTIAAILLATSLHLKGRVYDLHVSCYVSAVSSL